MSDVNPMEQASGQAVQTAAVALQVLVLAARALSEAHRREDPKPAPQPVPARQPAEPDHQRYAHMVRGIMQPPAVAEAIVNAPQWPQLAGELKKLEGAGVNVSQFLIDAAPLIARIDMDMRAGAPAPGVTASPAPNLRDPWAPPPGQQRDGPGMLKKAGERLKQTVPKLFKKDTPAPPDEASRELARLGISAQENTRLVIAARESISDDAVVAQMVASREWPQIASQMKAHHEVGINPRQALAGVPMRLRQAAVAGIALSPSEAARGLLNEQAKITAPQPARGPGTAPPTAPTAGAARASAPASSASNAPAPAPSAPAPSAPEKLTCRWQLTVPGENGRKTLQEGTVVVPKNMVQTDLSDLGVKVLHEATKHLPASAVVQRMHYQFSAYAYTPSSPVSYPSESVHLQGTDQRVRNLLNSPATGGATAHAASAKSTTATPGVTPAPKPQAAPATVTQPAPPSRSQSR
ncbi:hypothetical protein [Streptomyces sp. NPDC127103]|uniref:hypothetical protein n=1 Tax=Streptomyces sp. NPDC127103 TaxID=3347139 RepID=UPI00365EC7E4